MTKDDFQIYGQTFSSRLLLGTSRYPSPQVLEESILISKPAMVTASLRRQGANPNEISSGFWELLKSHVGISH